MVFIAVVKQLDRSRLCRTIIHNNQLELTLVGLVLKHTQNRLLQKAELRVEDRHHDSNFWQDLAFFNLNRWLWGKPELPNMDCREDLLRVKVDV